MIEAVVGRIAVECPVLEEVLPAAAAVPPRRFPSAYVFVEEEQARPNSVFTGTRQMLAVRLAVEVMVRRAEDANTGGAAQAELDRIRRDLRRALLGWVPGTGYTPFEYVGGRTLSYQDATLVWRDSWRTMTVLL